MLIEESIILFISIGFKFLLTLLYMVCCVFQATNLVNNYGQRKSAEISKVGENKQLLIAIVSGNFSHILILMNPTF